MAPRMSGRTKTPTALQNGVRFAVYALCAAVTAVMAAVFVFGMHSPDGPEQAYFGAERYLLIAALVLLGGGIVFSREYVRHHPAFRADAVLVTAMGAVLLLCDAVLWVSYGALQPPFVLSAYVAVNLHIALLSVLPLPFAVRLFTLIPARGNATQRFRHIAWATALLLTLGLVILTVFGGLWAMLPLSA